MGSSNSRNYSPVQWNYWGRCGVKGHWGSSSACRRGTAANYRWLFVETLSTLEMQAWQSVWPAQYVRLQTWYNNSTARSEIMTQRRGRRRRRSDWLSDSVTHRKGRRGVISPRSRYSAHNTPGSTTRSRSDLRADVLVAGAAGASYYYHCVGCCSMAAWMLLGAGGIVSLWPPLLLLLL